MKEKNQKIAIYGGNGFVGTHSAKLMTEAGAEVACMSRRGHRPLHLQDQHWSTKVQWCKGDAANTNSTLLSEFNIMVLAVGSPPLPTFSKAAFKQQLHTNGTTSVNAIRSAEQAGIKHIVLLSAQIPRPLLSSRFAYSAGKQQALQAAQRFAQISDKHRTIVLKPGMITGKRTLSNGKSVRLDWLTAPIAPLMPWQFVSIERVALRVADAVLNISAYTESYTEIKNCDI